MDIGDFDVARRSEAASCFELAMGVFRVKEGGRPEVTSGSSWSSVRYTMME
jgi:hypothetical protein